MKSWILLWKADEMSGSGRNGNNRKNRHRFSGRKDEVQKHDKKFNGNFFTESKFEKNRQNTDRLFWTAPVLPVNPITTPDCPWCGKQITDITTAISDKDTGLPVHFDCVLARITAEWENLKQMSAVEKEETDESVCYIGGGRFGVVHYNSTSDIGSFTIKKIFEWEIKDSNTEWRRPISEYFSIT
jgi:hypothetical protein